MWSISLMKSRFSLFILPSDLKFLVGQLDVVWFHPIFHILGFSPRLLVSSVAFDLSKKWFCNHVQHTWWVITWPFSRLMWSCLRNHLKSNCYLADFFLKITIFIFWWHNSLNTSKLSVVCFNKFLLKLTNY
jgi:hypothetical protein